MLRTSYNTRQRTKRARVEDDTPSLELMASQALISTSPPASPSRMSFKVIGNSEKYKIPQSDPCKCGNCITIHLQVAAEYDLYWAFVVAAEAGLNQNGVKVLNCSPDLIYTLEIHGANIFKKNDGTINAHADPDYFRHSYEYFRFLHSEQRRCIIRQIVHICCILNAVKPPHRYIHSSLRFYYDECNRVYCFPASSKDGSTICTKDLNPNLNSFDECARIISFLLFNEAVSNKIREGPSAFPQFDAHGHATCPRFIDLVRRLLERDFRGGSELEVHPYFCTPLQREAEFTTNPMIHPLRLRSHCEHPSLEGNGFQSKISLPRSCAPTHGDAWAEFHVLRRDFLVSTHIVPTNKHESILFNVITPGLDPRRTLHENEVEIDGFWMYSALSSMSQVHLNCAMPTADLENDARLGIRCHTCIGMRMTDDEWRNLGGCLHRNARKKQNNARRLINYADEVEYRQRVVVAEGAHQNMPESEVLKILEKHPPSTSETTKRKFLAHMSNFCSHLAVSLTLSLARAEHSFWCYVEMVMVKMLLARRFHLSRDAEFGKSFKSFILSFVDVIIGLEQTPKFVKNMVEFCFSGRNYSDTTYSAISSYGGGEASILESKQNAPDTPPICVEANAEHGTLRARLPFAFMSIFRSNSVQATFDFNALNVRDMQFFSSLEIGRGRGVSSAIVTNFFDAVFVDHSLFKEVADEHGGRPMYTLDNRENHVCEGCFRVLSTLEAPDDIQKTITAPTCKLYSPEFSKVLGLMMRYVVLCEEVVPYRIHPVLLYHLLRVGSSPHNLFIGLTETPPYIVRAFSESATNSMLKVADADLPALEVDFGEPQSKINLTALTRDQYMSTTNLTIFNPKSLNFWRDCCKNFHFPMLSMMLGSVCGDSVARFSAILSGSEQKITGSLLHSALTFEVHVADSFRFISLYETHVRSALSAIHAAKQDLFSMCYFSIMSISNRLAVLHRNSVLKLQRDGKTPSEARVSCHDQMMSRTTALLEEAEKTPLEQRTVSFCARMVHRFLRDYNVVLIQLMENADWTSGLLQEMCSMLILLVSAETSSFWARWIMNKTEETASRFIYMSTGKRRMEIKPKKDEWTRRTFDLPLKFFGMLKTHVEQPLPTLCVIECEKTRTKNSYYGFPGRNSEASNAALLIPDVLLDDLVNISIQILSELKSMNRDSPGSVRMYIMCGTGGAFDKIRIRDAPHKRLVDELIANNRIQKEDSLTTSVSTLINWNMIAGRLPMFSTCTRATSLFAYESYEAFERCMQMSLDEGENFTRY